MIMNLLKYLTPGNYYRYLTNQFMDFIYPRNILRIIHTKFENVDILIRANEDVGKRMLLNKFEVEELNFIKSQLNNDGVFIDIGANIGVFSLFMAAKSRYIQVHAFDPIKLNTNLLSTSIELNGLTNIVVNETCVGSSDGTVEFSLSSDSAYSSIIDSGRKAEVKKYQVPIITLDTYVSNMKVTRIDFIKIDVEGAEKLVIEGASKVLSNPLLRPKFMMIELCDINLHGYKTSVNEMVDLMLFNQYHPFVLKGNQLVMFDLETHANRVENIFFISSEHLKYFPEQSTYSGEIQ